MQTDGTFAARVMVFKRIDYEIIVHNIRIERSERKIETENEKKKNRFQIDRPRKCKARVKGIVVRTFSSHPFGLVP